MNWNTIETKPITYEPVIMVGTLECEDLTAAHEGYWTGKEWLSIRRESHGKRVGISNVTHWAPMPELPEL